MDCAVRVTVIAVSGNIAETLISIDGFAVMIKSYAEFASRREGCTGMTTSLVEVIIIVSVCAYDYAIASWHRAWANTRLPAKLKPA